MGKPNIIADSREIISGIPDILSEKANVIVKQLPVGDYIISERVAIERKRSEDFLDSLIKKRLFDQIIRLTEAYEKPVLILENDGLFSRDFDSRAIYGVIACFITDYNLPIIRTKDAIETAAIIHTIALREQFKNRREISLRGKRPNMSLHEWQQFIVEGFPNVSSILAQRLLANFGSVRGVMKASETDLQKVHGIGKKKAQFICSIMDSEWKLENKNINEDLGNALA